MFLGIIKGVGKVWILDLKLKEEKLCRASYLLQIQGERVFVDVLLY